MNYVKCSICNGTGFGHYPVLNCYQCNGTGKVQDYGASDPGKMWMKSFSSDFNKLKQDFENEKTHLINVNGNLSKAINELQYNCNSYKNIISCMLLEKIDDKDKKEKILSLMKKCDYMFRHNPLNMNTVEFIFKQGSDYLTIEEILAKEIIQ